MQAVILMDDYRLYRNINAFLRTFGIAEFTANAFIGNKIALFDFFCTTKGKGCTFNRLFR